MECGINIMSKKSLPDTHLQTQDKFVGKISTDPDQYMLANPVPLGILALVIFFGYGTLGSGFATGTQ
jgi:hypothetical protein